MKRIFFLLAAGQGACYAAVLLTGNLRQNIVCAELCFFAAFVLYLVSLLVLRTAENSGMPDGEGAAGTARRFFKKNYYLLGIIVFAICFRGILWLSPPTLSDDIYRYVWEGKLTVSGINPFAVPPEDPALAQLRDQVIYPGINRRDLAAVYPPLSQVIFALTAWLSPTLHAMKLTFIIFDVLSIGILLLTLRELTIDDTRIAIYALNPLIIMEFAGSGHSDSAGIFFLLCALYFFLKKRTCSPVACLALSVLNKFLPLVFCRFCWPGKRSRHALFLLPSLCCSMFRS